MKLLCLLAAFPLLLTAQPDPALEAYNAWEQQHRTGNRAQALFAASAEWTAKWPDSRRAWLYRRDSLLQTQNRSPELWKEVDGNLIRLSPPHTFAMLAAYDWAVYGINLKEAEASISAEIAWLEAQPRPTASVPPALMDRFNELDFSGRLFNPLCTLARVEIQLKEFEAAHAAIQRIHSWLEGDFKHYHDPDPLETFPDIGSTYYALSAELAEVEGRKTDALAFYHRVIADPYFRRQYGTGRYFKQARALWDATGGTKEGWTVFSEAPPLPAGVPAGDKLGTPFLPWVALDYRLPPLEGANFEGKTTFVYIWSSSCAPCWTTLPAIQALHDLLKSRKDFRVITLDLDEDQDRLARFMKEKGYDFPAVEASRYLKQLFPEVIQGQAWIVDATGTLRLQRTDNRFSSREHVLIDEAMYKMSHLAAR